MEINPCSAFLAFSVALFLIIYIESIIILALYRQTFQDIMRYQEEISASAKHIINSNASLSEIDQIVSIIMKP